LTLSTARAPSPHNLGSSQLAALARGRVTADATETLLAAESSKHRLLVEGVRRRAATRPQGERVLIDAAVQLLSDVEAHSPDIVASLIALPQIGSWAVECLRRMAADEDAKGAMARSVPLSNDLGYLAGIAAVAALRTGHPFDLSVPLRNGKLLLPGLGVADLDPVDPSGVVRIRLGHDGAVVYSGDRMMVLPAGADLAFSSFDARWSPTPRLHAEAGGLVLDVRLDISDPFLTRIGATVTELSTADRAAWQLSIAAAWRILVRQHRATAEAFAAIVSTLVPLAVPTPSISSSATSGWTFGAIGLSLPRDATSLTEMLVHELQHLVLGAIEDLSPLVISDRDNHLGYAPWRDDPRPAEGLLHGCYAYLGVTRFWRQQRRVGGPAEQLRSATEFARWRLATLSTVTKLARSPALTEMGRRFASGICTQLARWRAEPVPAEAEDLAGDVLTEHRVRWRLNNLLPADAQIEVAAQAWLSGNAMAKAMSEVRSTLKVTRPAMQTARAQLLEARYRDPDRIRRMVEWTDGGTSLDGPGETIDESDIALLRGDIVTALRRYSQRLASTDDMDAWPGLAVAWRHSGQPETVSLLTRRPEVVAAVYARLRTLQGNPPDPTKLAEWLAGYFAKRSGALSDGQVPT